MKILVTGGNGFIGRHVVYEALRRGHGVRVLTRPEGKSGAPTVRSDGADIVWQDLREPDGLSIAMLGVEAVVHCAAAMDGDLATQRAITVEGTKNLLRAMEEAGVKQIVGVSTFAVYDYLKLPTGATLDEESPLEEDFDARAPYTQVKREQEDLIREHAAAHGWKWTILRPGIVYGAGRMWFHHLGMQLSPTRWVCLAGGSLLPLTHVENCAKAIVNALESDAANGATLNIVDDDLPGRRRYMNALARRTTPRPSIIGVPWAMLSGAASVASWINRTLLLGKAPLPDILRIASVCERSKPLRYSNERAKEKLGWTPEWNLEVGLEKSFESR